MLPHMDEDKSNKKQYSRALKVSIKFRTVKT